MSTAGSALPPSTASVPPSFRKTPARRLHRNWRRADHKEEPMDELARKSPERGGTMGLYTKEHIKELAAEIAAEMLRQTRRMEQAPTFFEILFPNRRIVVVTK